MAVIPPEAIIIVVAIISALAGGMFVWLLGHLGEEEKGGAQEKVDPLPESEEEMALLSVSQVGDELAVFVQGRRYYHLRGITDSQAGRDAVQAIKAILTFAEGWLPALQQHPPPSEAAPQRSPAEARSFLEQLKQRDLFSTNSSPSPAPMKRLTVVGEIDELVQKKLEARPDLSQTRIRLTTDIHGDLLIYVGRQRFHSADEITDTEIRNLIQDAIHEWENR